jgi:hypothetical protein
MCGIVGLYLKTPDLEPELGRLTALMLHEMSSRGPDSAGFAVYGGANGVSKVSTLSRTGETDWKHLEHELEHVLGRDVVVETLSDHAIFSTSGDGQTARNWLIENAPDVSVLAAGSGGAQRHPCGCPYPDGDRKCCHHRRLAPVLDRRRYLPRA